MECCRGVCKILLVGGVSFICYISRAFAVFSFYVYWVDGPVG